MSGVMTRHQDSVKLVRDTYGNSWFLPEAIGSGVKNLNESTRLRLLSYVKYTNFLLVFMSYFLFYLVYAEFAEFHKIRSIFKVSPN